MLDDANSEEFAAVRDALLLWKSEGVENPIVPVYEDLDNDGVPDFYGLDENDELVLISGVTVADTVSPLDVPEEDDE